MNWRLIGAVGGHYLFTGIDRRIEDARKRREWREHSASMDYWN